MLFKWEKTDKRFMTGLSVVTWFAVLCYVTSFMDFLHVPVFLGLVVLFIVSYLYQYSKDEEQGKRIVTCFCRILNNNQLRFMIIYSVEFPEESSNLNTPPVGSSTPVDYPLPKKKSATVDASQ